MAINELKRVRRPDPDKVICPACTHDFVAIPENVQAELSRLRAANAELASALEKIRSGQHDPAIGGEEPELLEDQVWRYREWVRRDQDCAIDALSRAEQAKPEVETCVWTYEEAWVSGCGLQYINAVIDADMKFCPFCGKRVEVAGKAGGRQG